MGEGQPLYRVSLDGESVAGAWEMNPMVPAQVPSYRQAYFAVDDVDARSRRRSTPGARAAGAAGLPGWSVRDRERPQGASIGLLKTTPR
jgi:predicted enzyme related to lactoylglutathione lyase